MSHVCMLVVEIMSQRDAMLDMEKIVLTRYIPAIWLLQQVKRNPMNDLEALSPTSDHPTESNFVKELKSNKKRFQRSLGS